MFFYMPLDNRYIKYATIEIDEVSCNLESLFVIYLSMWLNDMDLLGTSKGGRGQESPEIYIYI